jgi:phage terminase large subunit-like protein
MTSQRSPALISRLHDLSDNDLVALEWQKRWRAARHDHQIPPTGDWWTVWLSLAGRGAGKTRGAAEWLGWEAWRHSGSRSLVAAPTSGDIRDTCFEGDSGLLNVIPSRLIRNYNRSLHELVLVNDSLIKGIAASEPERFRGPQFHRAWADEFAAWVEDQAAYDMMMFGLRLGERPRILATTTPKPKQLIMHLLKREGKDVVVTRASTYVNAKNLAPTFRDQILKYKGTKLGRQEIEAEVINPEEGGVIQRSWIKLYPHDKPLPEFSFIVVSLDTAFTEQTRDKKTGDPDFSACVVLGFFRDKDDNPAILILDAWQDRIGLPDLIKRAKHEMSVEYGELDKPVLKPAVGPNYVKNSGKRPDVLMIEDKGSGISLRQMLAREEIFAYPYNPGKAKKLDRLHAVSHIFQHGFIYAVESERFPGLPKTWYEDLINQLCTYSGEGSIMHDDLMDACVQGVRFMADKHLIKVTPKSLEEDEPLATGTDYSNPYAQ